MRQIYTLKFKSSRLKEFGYTVQVSFDEARRYKEVVALADSQMLRTIRSVRGQTVDFDKADKLFTERDRLYKLYDRVKSDRLAQDIIDIQEAVYNELYVADYITVVIENDSHYDYICENGITVNGKGYRRLSCSASQARKSTVVLCAEGIIDEVERRLDNDRDKTVPIAASKYNAYFGLTSSATQVVSEPRFIVVKDFENEATFKTHFVTETAYNIDDIVEDKEITTSFNRVDGMGLITPQQAEKWASELGLDYIPSQFGLRQSFMKGMLCVFPIQEFCEVVNNGNYIVDTIFKDENGEYIKADLRECDVIITESQFKLWNCYKSQEQYTECCHRNGFEWGVPQYSPKEAKPLLKMNYQFLQTLDLNENDIKQLAEPFVNWINGVSYDNYEYMLLFLLGVNHTDESIAKFIGSSDNYWLKSLILAPELKNDKYTRSKIRSMIKTRIQNGCMGDIFVEGNFQTLVSDPYGFMQHVCGLPVTGLLKDGEFYSHYWNERGVTQVDGMRSPLTFRSEHVILNLVKNEETERWYRYCKLGIILNYHGHEVQRFAGADFDLDILATTPNPVIIKGVYQDELTVTYNAPKPQKKVITKEDLCSADKFSFGSIIGSITNKSSNGYALLAKIEEEFGRDNDMYRVTYSRLIQCCKAQSAQIDKSKIGQKVKGIPKLWVEYKPTTERAIEDNGYNKEEIERLDFYNSILLDKHPYFFRYRYAECRKKYNRYIDLNEITCRQRFQMSLKTLMDLSQKTLEQIEFLDNFHKYMPVIVSNSPMNILCRYIEGINFKISEKTKEDTSSEVVAMLRGDNGYTEEQYEIVSALITEFLASRSVVQTEITECENERNCIVVGDYDILIKNIVQAIGNIYTGVSCAVDYFYYDHPSKNKSFLWGCFGRYIFNNIRSRAGVARFPFPDPNGNIQYLGNSYSTKEVDFELTNSNTKTTNMQD